jgi:hypothetical protein
MANIWTAIKTAWRANRIIDQQHRAPIATFQLSPNMTHFPIFDGREAQDMKNIDKRFLAAGVAIGVAVGVATDNLAIGIALGVAIGLAIARWKSPKGE